MPIDYEVADRIAVVRIDRPERANALDPATWAALADTWDRYEQDDRAAVAVLTGAPHRWFSAGFDTAAIDEGAGGRMHLPEGARRDVHYQGTRTKPVVAAVNGAAVGGGAFMAFHADLRVMAEDAFTSLPEVAYGRATGWQLFLQEQMPAALAAELVAGFRVPARRLHEAGVVNRICPPGEVVDVALGMASELARLPQEAMTASLSLVRACRGGNLALHPEVAAAGDAVDEALLRGDRHQQLVATRRAGPRR